MPEPRDSLALSRPTPVRYVVLAALCFAAVIAYVHRSCLSVPERSIRRDLDLDKEDMGAILGVFYFGYAIFQIPGGWLGGRFGTRLALTAFLGAWSVAIGLMPLAGGFAVLFLLQLVNGMAQAGIFPCCVQSFARWFPETERAFPNGMLGAFMSVGAALASFLTGFLLYLGLSWQQVLLAYALPGIVFAVLFYLWFRDTPAEHIWVNQAERQLIEGGARKPAEATADVAWRRLLTSAALWLVCGQQFFRAAGYVFYVTFFPAFLQNARGFSEAESGMFGSLPLMGVVLGSITGGLVMDALLRRTGNRWLSRNGVALVGVLGSAVFLAAAFLVDDPLVTVGLLTLSTFHAGLTGPAGYTATIDLGGRHVATVFSIMNTAGNIGAALLTTVLPLWVQFTSWDHVLLFQAGLYGAAAVCWSLLKVRGSIFDTPPSPPDTRIQAAG
jgi:sugar phosphate permease